MNEPRLTELIESYKQNFSTFFPSEKYKWEAIQTFQDNWNIDAKDFPEMLSLAFSKTDNLLASRSNFPLGMLKRYVSDDPEFIRSAFRRLFDESRDLVERIDLFKSDIKVAHQKRPKDERNDYQSDNAISTYLWLRYPDKYYIYKYSVASALFNELGIDIKLRGKAAEAIAKTYGLYDDVSSRLVNDEELKEMLDRFLDDNCYPDSKLKTMAIDFAYFVQRRLPDIEAERAKVAEEEVQSRQKEETEISLSSSKGYWWLNASPKVWSMAEWTVGEEVEYTLYNDNRNKRRVFQNFLDAKTGDIVVCYESNPTKKILALAIVSQENDGEVITFKMQEKLIIPIDYNAIREIQELQGMEFLVNPNGTFFKLTGDEYEILIDLIREQNPIEPATHKKPYSKAQFLADVFMSEEEYEDLAHLILHKKNVILQGAPGVGKTYCAKRLAHTLMEETDDGVVEVDESCICMVQFHQNYSYEDFVMGYKPDGEGFSLENGIFYNICTEAKNHPDKRYFLIVDEINRGNLSKIFGELLMLIENGYRDQAITLAYNHKPFSVPKNLYIIGMMNTADRSLAMIDYALRRRFSFFEMKPGFDTANFRERMDDLDYPKYNELVSTIKELNKEICRDDSLGSGFQIGHSYLCFEEPEQVTDEWLRVVVRYDILPMLQEYWFDNTKKYEEWEKALTACVNG